MRIQRRRPRRHPAALDRDPVEPAPEPDHHAPDTAIPHDQVRPDAHRKDRHILGRAPPERPRGPRHPPAGNSQSAGPPTRSQVRSAKGRSAVSVPRTEGSVWVMERGLNRKRQSRKPERTARATPPGIKARHAPPGSARSPPKCQSSMPVRTEGSARPRVGAARPVLVTLWCRPAERPITAPTSQKRPPGGRSGAARRRVPRLVPGGVRNRASVG